MGPDRGASPAYVDSGGGARAAMELTRPAGTTVGDRVAAPSRCVHERASSGGTEQARPAGVEHAATVGPVPHHGVRARG